MGSVALDGVSKRYGDVVAVDDVTLEVADREFLVLLGPSGCGKSTVLRMIAGLEDPSGGTITIAGRDVTDVEAVDRDVAMVFQSYALYPHLTVRGNIEFPLRSRRVDRAERERLVGQAADTLGLSDLLDRKPAQLSGGQRQRVALARAIVRRPQAFLMDEPLSNLDAKLRVQTRADLIELHDRLETTILYVTHDQVEAMTMGDRIAILDRGALQQIGPPQDVYRRPANLFVARFIGSPPMNTVTGAAELDGEPPAVRVGDATIPLPDRLVAAARQSTTSTVVVGVRPEHIALAADGVLPAEVAVVESLGHERHVVCRVGEELVIARQSEEDAMPRIGEPVRLALPPAHLHLFDAATGLRLPG